MPDFPNILDKSPQLEYTNVGILQNVWVDFGGSWAKAGWAKDAQGVVHLKGLIRDGIAAPGTLIFNLPVGYRPSERRVFTVSSYDGTNLEHSRVDVGSDGDVECGVQINNIKTTWLSLEGISFLAA